MASARGNGSGVDAAARQRLMRACAQASLAEMEQALAALGELPAAEELRSPQTGLIMLRGRIGGSGQPFNLGEAIMTRAAVQLATGAIGFSYLLGGSHRRARLAAIIDALGQDPHYRAGLEEGFIAPVMARRGAEVQKIRADAAATKVDFFTLVRGED
jgi:alpha-D-ribose 1-methylphosphonate 5-triphosphate synthase subunit PhnG